MVQKLKKITPEWIQIHLPPVMIGIVGLITGSIILTNQFIRQAENQFLSYIDIMYQNKQISLEGNLSLTTAPETITYPITANISFEDTSFPIIDLPAATVSQTPFGSFEGVRIYPERTYAKLTEAQEYWVTVNTSDFIDYSYQRFLQTYIPNIFTYPHSTFWQTSLATSGRAKEFLRTHLNAQSIVLSQEAENLHVKINPKLFRDISIAYYETSSGNTMSIEDRKWYEDMTSLIPSNLIITPEGQITATIESKFIKDTQAVSSMIFDIKTQPSVAIDYREPAERRRITEVPRDIVFTSSLKALASIEAKKSEALAEKNKGEELNQLDEESNLIEEDPEEKNEQTIESLPANLFETQKDQFRNRKWYSN